MTRTIFLSFSATQVIFADGWKWDFLFDILHHGVIFFDETLAYLVIQDAKYFSNTIRFAPKAEISFATNMEQTIIHQL